MGFNYSPFRTVFYLDPVPQYLLTLGSHISE